MESTENIIYDEILRNSKIINNFTVENIQDCKNKYPQTYLNFTILNEVLREVCDTFCTTADMVQNPLYRNPDALFARRAFAHVMKSILKIKEPIIAWGLKCSVNAIYTYNRYTIDVQKDIRQTPSNERFYITYLPKLKIIIEKTEKYVNKPK